MQKNLIIALMVVMTAALVSCANDHGTEPGPFDMGEPPTPFDLTVTPGTEQATVSWEYPPESMGSLKEFRVYYYLAAFDAVELVGTTTDLTYVDTKLVGNVEYCYRVSAVDTLGIEGWRTGEECALIETR
jgi:hypothetical protein